MARFADGSSAEADVIIGADGIHSAVRTALFGPDAPRFTGKICYRSVIPTAAVRGGALADVAADNGQWLGPHGTIVLYPLRGEELINVVAHYDDDTYRHESWVTRVPERSEVLERYAGWHESLLRLFEAGRDLVQVGALRPGPDPRAGRRGGSRCSATRRTRCCPTWGRAPARRSRTGRCSRTRCAARRPIRSRRSAAYERVRRPRASQVVLTARARGVSNHLPSRWAAFRRDVGDRGAAAAQPARHRRARRGLAGRLRRDLARPCSARADR